MKSNVLWMVMASVLAAFALVGCIDSDGNAGGESNEICLDGERCDFKCQGGSCALQCEEGSNCDGRCDGGECNFQCEDGATCDFACVGGECNFECEAGSNCDLTCAGGDCNFEEGGDPNPDPQPQPDPNPAPNPDPEPDAGGVRTCADLCTFTGAADDGEIRCVTTFMEIKGYNVTSSRSCLGIAIEAQCNACAAEFSIDNSDCAEAFTECF